LWVKGYLGEKGPETLYCPENHSGERSVERKYDQAFRLDADEPFWTSKGAVVRANDNRIGDAGRAHVAKVSARNYWAWQCGRTWDDETKEAEFRAGVCNVWLNYQVRFKREYLTYPVGSYMADGAMKKAEVARVGVVADQVDALLGTEPINNWLGFPVTVEAPERYEKIKPLRLMNHDNAFNVLFGDGSVKTFVDTGEVLWQAQVERYVVNGYANWMNCHARLHCPSEQTTAWDAAVWMVFFDPLAETP